MTAINDCLDGIDRKRFEERRKRIAEEPHETEHDRVVPSHADRFAGPLDDRWWTDLIDRVDDIARLYPDMLERGLYRDCRHTADALTDLQAKVEGWHDEQAAREVAWQVADLVYALDEHVAEIMRLALECSCLAHEARDLASCPEQYLDSDARDDGIEP